MDDDERVPGYKLIDAQCALLVITHCRCLRCSYRWRESSLIFRTERGYSYDQNEGRLNALANGSLPVSGRRLCKRVQGVCQNCAPETKIHIWESSLPFVSHPDERVDTTTTKRKARRSGPDPQAQALISHLLDL